VERRQQLQSWIAAEFPGRPFELAPASADASFRRYFRVTFADDPVTLIAMDAPPSHEDCRPFVQVAELFGAAGAHVPTLIRQNLEQGFLLLSDLGNTTYLQALTKDNAHNLYAEALGTLICIQKASRPDVLPEYSRELLMRELELFPVWYVSRHKGVTLTDQQATQLYEVFERILDVNMAEPKVFVHRDFHSRNLMITPTRSPGIIDFQGALRGPLTYDLASLLRDCYIAWPPEDVAAWVDTYRRRLVAAGITDADAQQFRHWFDYTGLQRHIKVLGLFCRLCYRDGKTQYLADLPLVLRYVLEVAGDYAELADFAALLARATADVDLNRRREEPAAV